MSDVLKQMSDLFGSDNPLDVKDPAKLLSTLRKVAMNGNITSFEDFKKTTDALGEDGKELFEFITGKIRKMNPAELVIKGFKKEQDVIDVLKKLESMGYTWSKGESPTKWFGWMKNFEKYSEEGGFILSLPKAITYGADDEEQKLTSHPDCKEIDFKDFLNQE